MKEIGGYMSLEQYHRPMIYEDGIKLNCGRNALAYLIEARGIKRIAMPYFMCRSVFDLCEKYDVQLRFYHVGLDLKPESISLYADEWLYLVNYYGQLTHEDVCCYQKTYGRVILDNAQAYFDEPQPEVDTLYTCRKFFGVPDGAVLFTNAVLGRMLEQDSSYRYMEYLMGRYEKTGSEFYSQMVANNDRFRSAPVLRMSKLTENLLQSIDYEYVKSRRTDNYTYLHHHLKSKNQLALRPIEGAFAYPLMIKNGSNLRKKLIQQKIYVPTLWPNVIENMDVDSAEYALTVDLLPLPCDQRYSKPEMDRILEIIQAYIAEEI